jgi:hypothetical protein
LNGQHSASVTVIALLKAIDGLWGLASGCALMAGGGAAAAMILHFAHDAPPWLSGILGGTVVAIGVFLAAFALFDLVLAWSIWKRQRWAWWLTLIVAVLSILGSAGTLLAGNLTGIPSVALNGIILVLLPTSDVRQAMGIG